MKKFQYSLSGLVIKATICVAIAASSFATIRNYWPKENQNDSPCFRATDNEHNKKYGILYLEPIL